MVVEMVMMVEIVMMVEMVMVVEMVMMVEIMINDQWHHDHYSGLSIGRKASAQDQRRSELGGVENIEHVVLVRKFDHLN